eukprot:111148-Hanusia_phi.AAC.1
MASRDARRPSMQCISVNDVKSEWDGVGNASLQPERVCRADIRMDPTQAQGRTQPKVKEVSKSRTEDTAMGSVRSEIERVNPQQARQFKSEVLSGGHTDIQQVAVSPCFLRAH